MSSTSVVQLGNNKYYTSVQDRGGVFSPDGQVTVKVVAEANRFCAMQNKVSDGINLDVVPEGALQFEQANYTFKCIKK